MAPLFVILAGIPLVDDDRRVVVMVVMVMMVHNHVVVMVMSHNMMVMMMMAELHGNLCHLFSRALRELCVVRL